MRQLAFAIAYNHGMIFKRRKGEQGVQQEKKDNSRQQQEKEELSPTGLPEPRKIYPYFMLFQQREVTDSCAKLCTFLPLQP